MVAGIDLLNVILFKIQLEKDPHKVENARYAYHLFERSYQRAMVQSASSVSPSERLLYFDPENCKK